VGEDFAAEAVYTTDSFKGTGPNRDIRVMLLLDTSSSSKKARLMHIVDTTLASVKNISMMANSTLANGVNNAAAALVEVSVYGFNGADRLFELSDWTTDLDLASERAMEAIETGVNRYQYVIIGEYPAKGRRSVQDPPHAISVHAHTHTHTHYM
jgi:hypothetical protein